MRREFLSLNKDLTGVRALTGGGRQNVLVLYNCRDGCRLAGHHFPGLDEEHGPASSILVLLHLFSGLNVLLGAGVPILVPAMDVQVNAEVKEGH